MPELPEVETVVRDLRPMLVGRTIVRVRVGAKRLRRPWQRAWTAHLAGSHIRAIDRRGKWIVIDLGEPRLLVHLGMTGQFTVAQGPRESHTHLVFTLDDAGELRFRDVRRFGSVTLYPDRAALDAFFTQSALGPEPFDVDAASLHQSMRASRRNLKAILLDQTVLAGVGNIYADESLFVARLHPATLGTHVSRRQVESLRAAIVAVLSRAIDQRGSSIRDYIGGSGLQGAFQDEFRAYGRTGEPCVRCKTPIERITLAGRSTHFCPRCQRKRA
jgi:formamidopyrimidine-DNA glycosylase